MEGTVLIADDDRSIRTVLTQALSRAGCRVHATGSLQQLRRWVEEGRGDLVVTDVMMPDGNGIEMIPAIRSARPDLPVIVISAQNTIVTAIRATEADAFDYLPKPFDLPDLLSRSRDALGRRSRREDPAPEAAPPLSPAGSEPTLPMIGRAPTMQALFRLVARVLNAGLPVMITGGPGSGKTMTARSLHELSDRAGRGFAVLTPADGSAQSMEQALASAGSGTLLIENPSGFSADAQARLMAMLERLDDSPGTAPRILSTAGEDPGQEVEKGTLRADLFYRLAGICIAVPPLTARLEDLPALAEHLLARAAGQGLAPRSLAPEALALLRRHPFRGNVRELDNLLRGLALTGSGVITAAEVKPLLDGGAAAPEAGPAAASPVPAGQLSASVRAHLQRYFDLHGDALPPPGLHERILREVEAPLLEIAMDATGGNQLRCAELLGINRNTLRKKLSDMSIQVTRRRRVM